jgi:hypothetical protein
MLRQTRRRGASAAVRHRGAAQAPARVCDSGERLARPPLTPMKQKNAVASASASAARRAGQPSSAQRASKPRSPFATASGAAACDGTLQGHCSARAALPPRAPSRPIAFHSSTVKPPIATAD